MSQLDWRKEKAILEQKNELLQLQVIELKEREENQKKFNESILSAYNSMNDGLETQSSPNSSAILRQFQKRQDSHSPNRLTLAQQLKQLTSELKHAKNIQKENETDVSSSQLKHEIKFMINKLLKAKGKMTESFVDRKLC